MKPFVVGLTGGVGMGKSTVLQFFHEFGVHTLSADKIAHELVKPGEKALLAIESHFGSELIQKDKTLNRQALRKLIFDSPQEKKWLEDLLHPLIREAIQHSLQMKKGPYAMVEIPLLTHKKDYPYLDCVLLVTSAHEKQIERVSKRDKTFPSDVEKIIQTQLSNEKRIDLSDDILENNGSLETLKQACHTLHLKYLATNKHS
jgi:dephospho-CoA kinase